mmetsp:Transcript_46572/g.70293  ORF Transcript_46572/g.70293 Transcript_46572/m.70293 type:complete len:134 (+) Transcript_46572:731-1132(+)
MPDECGVDHPDVSKMFPSDAIERAREIKQGLGGVGSGAYSHSQGARCFREEIAKFIEERDGGVPCDVECLFMSNGASSAINFILTALIADETWYVFSNYQPMNDQECYSILLFQYKSLSWTLCCSSSFSLPKK